MHPVALPTTPAALDEGEAMLAFVREILPLRRCITGDGLRATLDAVGRHVELRRHEVPTGTPIHDWTAPPEWRVRSAAITLPDGTRLADWAWSPLHLVQYSRPVRRSMRLGELAAHVHTLPDQPDLVPYRTGYWSDGWGFCLADRDWRAARDRWGDDADVEVEIDAELVDGALSLGEALVEGRETRSVLISAHTCHPALANDNAASIAVATWLARDLASRPELRRSYTFVFAPGTVGALAWLSQSEAASDVEQGLVLANLGNDAPFVYKRSRRGTLGPPAAIDRAVGLALPGVETRPFTPFGYDERQYNHPGVDLPVGRLTRSPHGEYPEYHTSGDSLALLSAGRLQESLDALRAIVDELENVPAREVRPELPGEVGWRSTTQGEPMLGRHGLYAPIGGRPVAPEDQQALMWVLQLADGHHSPDDMARLSGFAPSAIQTAIGRLRAAGLLRRADA